MEQNKLDEQLNNDCALDQINWESNDPFTTVLLAMNRVHIAKNSDYGNSFDKTMDQFGVTAAIIRLSDKMNRLVNLTQHGNPQVKESIEDTLLDMANYCVMTLAYLKKDDH